MLHFHTSPSESLTLLADRSLSSYLIQRPAEVALHVPHIVDLGLEAGLYPVPDAVDAAPALSELQAVRVDAQGPVRLLDCVLQSRPSKI